MSAGPFKRALRLGLLVLAMSALIRATSPCPWATHVGELENSCICDYNLARELSVQCDTVDYNQLLGAMRRYAAQSHIDLFYVNNSTIGNLKNNSLALFRITTMQFSHCKISHIDADAFRGQENSLKSLNLRENEINELPIEPLRRLKNLTVLDLSKNRISVIPEGAFAGHKLITLKLSNNEITLAPGCFRGVEGTLKNLNLMGTRQKKIPEALRGLKMLAFLDLSQNSIRELPGPAGAKAFDGMDSLTGLNLERNLIQAIGPNAFQGIKHTLSSLSLLNNLIPEFPTIAINSVHDLKVLDIGFNLITELPINAFQGNPSITLLAIDGNPLSTVPEEAFMGLNGTLRGLSLGGRFLVCDCKLRWIVEWIRTRDLQVTSRESKPQFCGAPHRLQDRNFYGIKPDEMSCDRASEIVGIGTVESVDTREPSGPVDGVVENLLPTNRPILGNTRNTTYSTSTSISSSTTLLTSPSGSSDFRPSETSTHHPITSPTTPFSTSQAPSSPPASASSVRPSGRPGNVFVTRPAQGAQNRNGNNGSPISNNIINHHQEQHVAATSHTPRSPLVLGSPLYKSKSSDRDIVVKEVLKHDNAVVIRWDAESSNVLGFRVIYRLFGDAAFKQAPPLDANEREFTIKNVPPQECIIVCVVSLEETNVNPSNVPFAQCQEVRTDISSTYNMDKITIGASAMICATILVALIIFLVANRRRARKLHTLHNLEQTKIGGPISGLPVNCCSSVGPTPSPGGPLPSMATLSAYNVQKEWDQVSAYSTRSIPRPRIFPVDRQDYGNFQNSVSRDNRWRRPPIGCREPAFP